MPSYKVEYLSLFRKDLKETVGYITKTLKAPVAAVTLTKGLFKSIDRMAKSPYIYKIYTSTRPLSTEYRMMMVKNYAVFYFIDEQNKTVKIYRMLYGRRNFDQLI